MQLLRRRVEISRAGTYVFGLDARSERAGELLLRKVGVQVDLKSTTDKPVDTSAADLEMVEGAVQEIPMRDIEPKSEEFLQVTNAEPACEDPPVTLSQAACSGFNLDARRRRRGRKDDRQGSKD